MKTPNTTEDPCHLIHSMFIQDGTFWKVMARVFPPLWKTLKDTEDTQFLPASQ